MKKVITNLSPSVTLKLAKRNLSKLLFFTGILFLAEKSSSQNLLADSSFEPSITPYYTDPPPLNMWLSWVNSFEGASFTTNVQNGVCSYFIDSPGPNMYDIQLTQYGFPLILNHRYRLSFDVKADAERDSGVYIGEFQGGWRNLNPSYLRHATSEWQTITIDVDAIAVFPLNKLSFEMGVQKINMYFANVSLTDLGLMPTDKVVIAGTFEHALGCANDWDPNCDFSALTLNPVTGLWAGTFNVPAGCHQYKVTINGTWDINYGENGLLFGANMSLYVPVQTSITFTYDPSTHIVQTTPVASGFSPSCLPSVVLTGSFQSELGCNNDWDATCANTALNYSPATGQFENDLDIPSGYYEYRAILNGDWYGNNFGVNGKPDGPNYAMYLSCPTKVHFSYDPITHVVTETYINAQPNTVVIAGSFQSEVGCSGDWQPDCDHTRLHYDANGGFWISDTLDIPAGHWKYKVTINNSWEENYGLYGERNGANYSLDLCSPGKVVFVYFHNECYNEHNVYSEIYVSQPGTVVVAGTFQSEVGCSGDWQPDCDKTRMHYDPLYGGAWVSDT